MRAIVRVTSVAGRDAAERALLAQVDVRGPLAARAAPPLVEVADEPIVVEASTPGLPAARVSIPTSSDAATAGVLAAAAAAAGKPVDFFGAQ